MLADRLLQLHSSAAQSPVLGAARPFRFPRAAPHSDIPTPGAAPAIAAAGRAKTTGELTGAGRHRASSLCSAGSRAQGAAVPGDLAAQLGFPCWRLETGPGGGFFRPVLKRRCLWSRVGHGKG